MYGVPCLKVQKKERKKYNCYKGLAVISCFELVGGVLYDTCLWLCMYNHLFPSTILRYIEKKAERMEERIILTSFFFSWNDRQTEKKTRNWKTWGPIQWQSTFQFKRDSHKLHRHSNGRTTLKRNHQLNSLKIRGADIRTNQFGHLINRKLP